MTPAQAYCVETLWRLGRPTLALLDKGQQGWIATFRQHGQHGVWMVARQRGKTYAALTMAVELAMSTPGAIIRYAAKTGKSARSVYELTQIGESVATKNSVLSAAFNDADASA